MISVTEHSPSIDFRPLATALVSLQGELSAIQTLDAHVLLSDPVALKRLRLYLDMLRSSLVAAQSLLPADTATCDLHLIGLQGSAVNLKIRTLYAL